MSGDAITGAVATVAVLVGALVAHSAYTTLQAKVECKARGGVPVERVCLKPEAVLK